MNAAKILSPPAAGAPLAQASDPILFRRPQTWPLLFFIIQVCAQNGPFAEQISPGHLLASSYSAGPKSCGLYLLLTVMIWAPFSALVNGFLYLTVGTMLRQKAVLAFPILAMWSSTPDVTLRKKVLLFLAFAFGWFLAVAFAVFDEMRLFLFVGVVLGLASIPMAVLIPAYLRDSRGGCKGVFTQKNALGGIPGLRRLISLIGQAVFPIGLIVMSQSKEALVGVAILIDARLTGPFIASRRREQLPFLLYATAFAIAAIVLGYGILLALLNRDATLSGRTEEWAVLIYHAFKHFWLDYGYAAFWNGIADSLQAIHAIRGSIHGAHSRYLDTMLQFGVVSLSLWIILFFVSLRDMARGFRKCSLSLAGYWYGGIFSQYSS